MSANESKVQAHIDNGIGAFVWWEFDSVAVDPTTMQNTLNAHGLNITVPTIDPEIEIRKAASAYSEGGRLKTKYRAEYIQTDDAGMIEVAILRHDRKARGQKADPTVKKTGWTQCDTVIFERDAGTWFYGGMTPQAKRFIAAADARRTHLGHEFVRDVVVMDTLNRLGAFPLRRRLGGFYFVPSANLGDVHKIAAVLADLPADVALNVATVTQDSGTKAAVGRSARDHVMTSAAAVIERIKDWQQAARCPHGDAVDAALAEFGVLRDHAALYADALGVQMEDLHETMKAAMQDAEQIVEAIQKGLPPGLLITVRQLADAEDGYGLGVEIPYGELESIPGLTSAAWSDRARHYWGRGRGNNAAIECGFNTTASETGVTFTDPKAAPAPEDDEAGSQGDDTAAPAPDAAPEDNGDETGSSEPEEKVVLDEDESIEAMVKKMDDAKLREAITLVTGKAPSKQCKRATLERKYLDAVSA